MILFSSKKCRFHGIFVRNWWKQNSVISTLCHYTMYKEHLKNISWNQFPLFNSFPFSVLPCMLPLLRDNLKSSSIWSRHEELNLILEAKVDRVPMILLGTESLKNPPNICVNLCPLDGDRTTLQFRFGTSNLYFWIIHEKSTCKYDYECWWCQTKHSNKLNINSRNFIF